MLIMFCALYVVRCTFQKFFAAHNPVMQHPADRDVLEIMRLRQHNAAAVPALALLQRLGEKAQHLSASALCYVSLAEEDGYGTNCT